MDIVLEFADYYFLDKVYGNLLPKNGLVDQFVLNSPTFAAFSTAAKSTRNSFNTTIEGNKLPLPFGFVINKISSLQNKEDIYGLKPSLLPATKYIYSSMLGRSNLLRELISIFFITAIFGWALYLSVAYISYLTVFDKKIFNHPRYLKNQIYLEIHQAVTAIPTMVLLTAPFFLLDINGYSKLYFKVDESTGGWKAVIFQVPAFILFTDCLIYYIHRWLHWPLVYKRLHKPHHKWIVCTPFASHAFHPVDGWAQGLPYHIFPMLFPLHKVSHLFLFTFVNFWTVMIHDGQYLSNDPFINGTACHTIHHLYFNYNYGQFTTLWDRLGGSYRKPDDSFFVKNIQFEKEVWNKQTEQMEAIRGKLEGGADERVYIST